MVCINLIKNLSITSDDVKIAKNIYAPNMCSLKGKLVKRAPKHVTTKEINAPQENLKYHQNTKLAVDIMFVNWLPFVVCTYPVFRLAT